MRAATNVMLTGAYANPVAEQLNLWLRFNKFLPLVEVSNYGGGNHASDVPVWLGTFKNLDLDLLIGQYRDLLDSLRVRSNTAVELRVCRRGSNYRKVNHKVRSNKQ